VKGLWRPFNVASWPIWVKLSAGFIFAVAFSVALIVFITQSSATEIITGNLRSYIAETGKQQRDTITANLGQARTTLFNLATQNQSRLTMAVLVQSGANTTLEARARAVDRLFKTELLDPGTMFLSIRFLDANGKVMVSSATKPVLLHSVGADDSRTPIYAALQNAIVNGQKQATVVADPSSPYIEMAYAVGGDFGQVIGFIVGQIDLTRAIFQPLGQSNPIFPSYTYLITNSSPPVVLVQSGTSIIERASLTTSPAVQRAFQGLNRTESYTVGRDTKTEMIGYYGTISDPTDASVNLFALVAETEASLPATQSLQYYSGGRAFALGVGLLVMVLLMVGIFNQLFASPLNSLRQAVYAMSKGDFTQAVPVAGRGDEIGALGAAFVDMREQVRNLLDDLEARIAARARDINATQEVSRFAARQNDLQTLIDQVVELIIKHFPNIYHAQIFLLDSDRVYAELRASTGEVGRQLLARKHRLAVGSVSVIGQVTQQGQLIVARDTAISQVHRHNEFLPHTRAELAIPLRVGDELIGALDVQSKLRNAFSEDETIVLQTMADQIAVAIQNARLYQESVRQLRELNAANRDATRAAWQEYIHGQRARQITSEAGVHVTADTTSLRQRAMAEGRIVLGEATSRGSVPVAVPIQLRGQTLGAVEWELPAADIDNNRLQLAQELANRLAISLENARLFEESQRAAERERIVNAISAKLTPQTEIEEILQTAVREVGQALRAPQVSIRLQHTNGNGNGSSMNGSNGTNHADKN
jgi:GAF domain-containing protein/HAMP domain-containing protein